MSYLPTFNHTMLGAEFLRPKMKSIQDVDLSSDTKILDWVKTTVEALSHFYGSWYRMCCENVSVYTGGVNFDGSLPWAGESASFLQRGQHTKTNYIGPIVETQLSRLVSSRAAISVIPVHSSEYSDKSAAKTSEQVIKTIFRDRNVDDLLENTIRHMLVCGSAYIQTTWDSELGFKKPDGKSSGDVNYKMLNFNQIMLEPTDWESTNWFFSIERFGCEELKRLFPEKAAKISQDNWNPYLFVEQQNPFLENSNEAVTVLTLHHRASDVLPEGLIVKCTRDCILSVDTIPFPTLNSQRKLPLSKVADIIPPGFMLPVPLTILETAKGSQHLVNQLNKVISRDIQVSAPKWLVQKGTVSIEHLNNQAGIIQYRGSREPKLAAQSTVRPELFEYRRLLIDAIRENTGSFRQSFGDSAPNTRAGIMLEFHEEQEFKRSEPLIKKVNNFIVDLAQKTLAIAADFYKEDEDRKIKVTGEKFGGPFRNFDTADLTGSYDIIIERSNALPESKEGRLRWITTLNEMFPGKFDWEQVKKALDFSSDKDLRTAETAAFELQCLENDLLFRGEPAKEPAEYEDHITHLKALYPVIDSLEFAEAPEEIKQAFLAHTSAHEMFAWKTAMTNPVLADRVLTLKQFPKVFVSLPSVMPISGNSPVPPQAQQPGGYGPAPTVFNSGAKSSTNLEPTDPTTI